MQVKCACCGIGYIDYESNDICSICGWEDDWVQNDNPDYTGGANVLSLNEHRKKFRELRKEDPDYIWADNPEKMRN